MSERPDGPSPEEGTMHESPETLPTPELWAQEPAAAEPPVLQASTTPHPARRKRGVPVWAFVLVVALAIGAAVPLAMLIWSRDAWESENAALRDHVASLTGELDDANARISDLSVVEEQLETLKAEYSVQVDDGVSAAEVTEELEAVIEGYQECVDAQQEHFEVLKNPGRYVASSIAESERSILEYCTGVTDAYLAFLESHE